jgi:hypothetical protein
MNDADKTPGVFAGETLEVIGAAQPDPAALTPPPPEVSTGRSAFFVGAAF